MEKHSSLLTTLSASLALAAQVAHGTEIRWDTWVNGNLADGDNWIGDTAPSISDSIKIDRGQSKPLWLSQDLTATGGDSYFIAGFTLSLTNATGEARTLTLSKLHSNRMNAPVSLTAGTLSLTSNFYMGDNAQHGTNGVFVVDGAGTMFNATGEIRVGSDRPGSMFIVTNGAAMIGSTLQVGFSTASNGLVRVAGSGSTATFSSAVQFGSSGGNRVEVLDGACLTTTNLYVRRLTNYSSSTVWDEPCSLVVSGTGSKVVVNGTSGKGVYVGNTDGSGCSVVVENDAEWESHGEFQMAADSATDASFRVESKASFSHDTHGVFVGSQSASRSSFIVDDATMAVSSSRGIEVRGANATLAVSNGGTVTTATLILGTNGGENDALRISGASSRVAVGGTLELRSDGVIAVEIPERGFSENTAPISCKTLTLDAAAKMSVTIDRNMRDSGRIVLVEATNDITIPEGFTFELPDAGDFPRGKVTLDLSNAKQIAVKVNCDLPTVISFR